MVKHDLNCFVFGLDGISGEIDYAVLISFIQKK